MPETRNWALLQMTVAPRAEPRTVRDHCLAFFEASTLSPKLWRVALAADLALAYVYVELARAPAPAELDALAADFTRRCPWAHGVRASRLELVFETSGASANETPAFHYVVEMDPEAGWMPEISRWYDIEHMPGLAAVPGCTLARRFINHGHGPLSLACYDLAREDALGSPEWLAIRATAWSDIARPHFTNTRRTMFRIPSSGPRAAAAYSPCCDTRPERAE